MGRITPIRWAEKEGYINTQYRTSLSKFNTISLLFSILAFCIELYLVLKYFTLTAWALYSSVLIVLWVISFLGIVVLNQEEGEILVKHSFERERDSITGLLIYISMILITIAAIGILNWIFGYFIRFAMETTDLYLYYIAAAIIEEQFFRMFLISAFERYNLAGIGILVQAFAFMFAHWEVYSNSVYTLIITLVAGLVFGMVYYSAKDISITMSAHIIINLIAVGSLLVITN